MEEAVVVVITIAAANVAYNTVLGGFSATFTSLFSSQRRPTPTALGLASNAWDAVSSALYGETRGMVSE